MSHQKMGLKSNQGRTLLDKESWKPIFFLKHIWLKSGLPDFSLYNITKTGEIYQITIIYHDKYQMATIYIYQMATKYTEWP
jgi:hypothetical protein